MAWKVLLGVLALLHQAACEAQVASCESSALAADEALTASQGALALLQVRLNGQGGAAPQPKRRLLKQQRCLDSCVPAVFVVSSGRAGSTSIMHMLNLIPGYDIKGENMNMWGSFHNMYAELNKNWGNYEPSHFYAWRRSSQRNSTEMLCGLQTLVLAELNPSSHARVVGFKEKRWGFDKGLKDLDTLMEVFPCAKVVLNYREDLDRQLISHSRAFGDFSYYDAERANKELKNFASRNPDRSFVLPLEDFSVGRFNELLHFLGEDHDCKYVDVVHDNADRDFTQTPEPLLRDAINCTSFP